ncbi:MAG: glycosyltransferase family 39 protein, partial [Chloroflexi bacterium]|nr:glycosyltransferase family 39 protein [Chloroflexota bacterium]
MLILFFALSLSQIVSTSPTFDEGFYILRGYAFFRTGYLIPLGHPPFAQTLSALGVMLEPNLPDPQSLDGWATDKYDDASRDLLWQRGLNATRIVFLARFPILLIGLIVGAITFKWAKELFGWRSGVAALALHALSPNLLAHAALATTDLPVAAFYFFTLCFVYRFTKKQNLLNATLTGLTLGLALASKFSGLLLIPTLGLLTAIYFWQIYRKTAQQNLTSSAVSVIPSEARNLLENLRDSSSQRTLLGMTKFILGFWILGFGIFTLWSTYFFSLSFTQYFSELTHLNQLASEGHNAFLFGEISTRGWWYYHLIVFFVKTPLPVLVLFVIGVLRIAPSVTQNAIRNTHFVYLFIPTLLYCLAASLTSLNVGYRYLLPVLPLVHIIASSVVRSWKLEVGSWDFKKLFIVSLFSVHSFSTFFTAPNFLSYFNELVGANGYKILSDSNIDWGQDLPALGRYLNGRKVYLSYFGQADPSYYGINATMLPGWPPPGNEPTFYSPADPAPGLYAISASNLSGVQLYDANAFAYFRELKPSSIINHSIFIFEIPERKPVTAIAQCAPTLLNNTGSLINKPIRQITFDCDKSLIIPNEPTLLLYPSEKSPIIGVGNPVHQWRWNSGITRYRLYRVESAESNSFIAKGKYLSLIKFDLTSEALILHWRVEEPAPPPVSIFAH